MANGIVVFPLPLQPKPSDRFRNRFNDVAKELKLGITWDKDASDPLQVNPDEVSVSPDQWAKYGLSQKTPSAFSKNLSDDVRKILQEVERRRVAAANDAAHQHEYVTAKLPLHVLNPVEKEALRQLRDHAKPLIDSIEAHQQRYSTDEDMAYVAQYGDANAKQMAKHSPYETCLGFAAFDMTCSPLPYFPDRPPLNAMIAPDISVDEFLNLGKTLPADAEELRPTTMLMKRDGKIVAIPLPKHPLFQDDHQKLAAVLDRVAALKVDGKTLDGRLVKQLKAWAIFCRTGSAQDERVAVQATIDAGEGKGHLRVHIGPSESYWDDNTKFPYNIQVGIRDPRVATKLSKSAHYFLKMEASLQSTPYYKPRKLSVRGGFADPIYQAITGGFIRSFPLFEPMGNNFPNYAGYHVQGSNRFILMESVIANLPARMRVADKMTDEDLATWNLPEYFPMFVVNHESGHLLGPQRDHMTPDGQKMGAIFGAHWGSADEPKADLVNSVMAYLAQQEKGGRVEDVKALARVNFVHLMTRYKSKKAFLDGKLRDHYFGVMMELAHFIQSGALTVVDTPKGKRLCIDYQKWPKAGDQLWRDIIAFQAKGDLEGYLNYAKAKVQTLPDEVDQMILEANKGTPLYFVERQF